MNRKLLLLDLVLACVVIWIGVELRLQWLTSKARETAIGSYNQRAVPVPPLNPLPPQLPVMPSGYVDIAQKMLLDQSRNPNVVVEVPQAPPPKPMPPLPVYHGMMNIGGGGPTAILSLNATAVHQGIHPGDTIGQFKLLDVNSEGLTFEWEGKQVHKTTEELMNRAAAPAEAPVATRTDAPVVAAPPPAPVKAGPGEETSFGFRQCNLNDGVAEGGVSEGYRKVMYKTPFGPACRYEAVGK